MQLVLLLLGSFKANGTLMGRMFGHSAASKVVVRDLHSGGASYVKIVRPSDFRRRLYYLDQGLVCKSGCAVKAGGVISTGSSTKKRHFRIKIRTNQVRSVQRYVQHHNVRGFLLVSLRKSHQLKSTRSWAIKSSSLWLPHSVSLSQLLDLRGSLPRS